MGRPWGPAARPVGRPRFPPARRAGQRRACSAGRVPCRHGGLARASSSGDANLGDRRRTRRLALLVAARMAAMLTPPPASPGRWRAGSRPRPPTASWTPDGVTFGGASRPRTAQRDAGPAGPADLPHPGRHDRAGLRHRAAFVPDLALTGNGGGVRLPPPRRPWSPGPKTSGSSAWGRRAGPLSVQARPRRGEHQPAAQLLIGSPTSGATSSIRSARPPRRRDGSTCWTAGPTTSTCTATAGSSSPTGWCGPACCTAR